ncbi:MAG: threonine dehydratase [Limisphaerales bacterium]
MLDLDAIRAAQTRLKNEAVVTPLLQPLPGSLDRNLFVKAECLQRTGSFKFRGAYNALAQLRDDQRKRGVVACSSGNHAQGVALAARLLNIHATIVMPEDAPLAKIEGTKALGAQVLLYDRDRENRESLTRDAADASGAEIVWPYDDYRVMAGQGTCGLELHAQATAAGSNLDTVLIPCGGGGLTAGVATALAGLAPATEVCTVEPEGFDDHARSFTSGKPQSNAHTSGSICDALLASRPGELTFPINQQLVARGFSVTDEEVVKAMAFAFKSLRIVAEPGGAAALAAALFKQEFKGKNVAVIVTGGNVDASQFSQLLAADQS